MSNNQYELEFESNFDEYYIDQSFINGCFISSCYTSYGIKCIDSQYAFLIMNMHRCGTLYTIERNVEKYIWKGIECEGTQYIETYKTIDLNDKKRGMNFGVRVIYDNGNQKDFFYGQKPIFDTETRKIDIEQLINDIKADVHLHVKIKENLLENIKNYEESSY